MKHFTFVLFIILLSVLSCKKVSKDSSLIEPQLFDVANLDTTINPGDNFHLYATGGWAKANPIPNDYPMYSKSLGVVEKTSSQLKVILEELLSKQQTSQSGKDKLAKLYRLSMESIKLNKEGFLPIKPCLDSIKKAQTLKDIIKLAGQIKQFAKSPFIDIRVSPDIKENTTYRLHLSPTTYSFAKDIKVFSIPLRGNLSDTLKTIYKGYIKKQFQNCGYSESEAMHNANIVLKIETELANINNTGKYNKTKWEDLDKMTPFEWELYFDSAGIEYPSEIVYYPSVISNVIRLIETTPVEDSKVYLSWCVISAAAPYLSDQFLDALNQFDLESGNRVISDRWERSVFYIERNLSDIIGKLYVDKYYSKKMDDRLDSMIQNLKAAFEERIDGADWMSDSTKAKTKKKLNAVTFTLGYPNEWGDFSDLEIKEDSYWENIKRINKFNYQKRIKKIGMQINKSSLEYMPVTIISGSYDRQYNDVFITAAYLQPPYFYVDDSDAINYASIGSALAHEISHGFDKGGVRVNIDGYFEKWWNDDEIKAFDEKIQKFSDYIKGIEILPGLYAKEKNTIDEYIADLTGLLIAYDAFSQTAEAKEGKMIDGYSPQQRFFLAYANTFAEQLRNEQIINRTQNAYHPIGKLRVNHILPHIDAWYDAFDITESNSLFIPKEKRADVW